MSLLIRLELPELLELAEPPELAELAELAELPELASAIAPRCGGSIILASFGGGYSQAGLLGSKVKFFFICGHVHVNRSSGAIGFTKMG